MPKTNIKIRNMTGSPRIWGGQTVDASSEYIIQDLDRNLLVNDENFRQDLENGLVVVDNGSALDATYGLMAITLDTQSFAMIANGMDGTDALSNFLDEKSIVTDPYTGIKGPFYLMQELVMRRDLYNDSTNPLYVPGHSPLLGTSGIVQDCENRVLNLEMIHDKTGWHEQQVTKAQYSKPLDLLIYYGWLNSFNSADNGWNNEKVAVDMAKYQVLVFGDGVENPSHGDYANTQIIIPRIKALNPDAKIFGYVSTIETFSNFSTKASQWNTLGVHGIFMDEAGYDYGMDRSGFNARVDYIHGLSSANLAFANSWNPDNILGITNDPSYPNSTYNPGLIQSNLGFDDWVLIESFPINVQSYPGYYEDKDAWYARGVNISGLRYIYGVNVAGVSVIDNTNANGTNLFQFGYTSASMWSFEAFGSSDNNYGSSSASVKYWSRPSWTGLRSLWALAPTVTQATDSTNKYYRFTENGKLIVDFSTGSQNSSTYIYGNLYQNGSSGTTGVQGTTGVFGLSGSTGVIGATGIQGIQGITGIRGFTGMALGSTGIGGPTGVQGATGISGLRIFQFFADQLDSPNNTNWAVNAMAPTVQDSTNSSLVVRSFDDTLEEGVGFILETPPSVNAMDIYIRGRAENLRASPSKVVLRLFKRDIASDTTVSGWDTTTRLTPLDVTTSVNYRYYTQSYSMSTLGVSANRITQFELTRNGADATDTLVGNWNLLQLGVAFY